MALIRFLIALLIFIGVLASASVIVFSVILMLRFPPMLVAVGIAFVLFYWVIKRFPSIE